MSNVTSVGIDLAKNVFSLHGVDAAGVVQLRKTVSRTRLVEFVAQLPPCVIGLEACSGAHEWARRFTAFGHTVKLMAPKFVVPYRRGGKNDGNDADSICEAVSRPSMRFVPIKSLEQQAVLTLHRVRQGFIEERMATINRVRGLLAEFGVVLPQRSIEVREVLHWPWNGCLCRWRARCAICWNTPGYWRRASMPTRPNCELMPWPMNGRGVSNSSAASAPELIGHRRECCRGTRVPQRSAVRRMARPRVTAIFHGR